jgi:hypothetical protein
VSAGDDGGVGEPKPRVRWTEHGPEPIDEEEEAPASADDPAAVRARLAARGVLLTEPSVRIRDVAGDAATPPPVAPAVDRQPDPVPDPGAVADADDDAETLDADPGGPSVAVRCRSCRSVEDVSVAATGYRCGSCRRVWRWAVCGSCSHLGITPARQESWRCPACGATTRSWWRTAAAAREAVAVAEHKRVEAGEVRRRRLLGALRRQRTKIALTVAAFVVVGGASVAVRVAGGRDGASAGEAGSPTCRAFSTLDADLTAATIPPARLRSRLDALAASAAEADDGLRVRAQRLAAAGQPGDRAFDDARAALRVVCPKGP